MSKIDAVCWDLLAENCTLQDIRLDGNLEYGTLMLLATALTCNTTLRVLELSDASTQAGFGAFAGTLTVNRSLEQLCFRKGRILTQDLLKLSEGLWWNRTLKVLELPSDGLTPERLQPLIQTVRYHTTSLDHVFLPLDVLPRERALLASANVSRCMPIIP